MCLYFNDFLGSCVLLPHAVRLGEGASGMKCAACGTENPMSNRYCVECGQDLLKLGGAKYAGSPRKPAHPILQEARADVGAAVATEISELSVPPTLLPFFRPIVELLGSIATRGFASEEELDGFADDEAAARFEAFESAPGAEVLVRQADERVKAALGEKVYGHFKAQEQRVITTLRAAEVACIVVPQQLPSIDPALREFFFCKAGEIASWVHSRERYVQLRRLECLEDIRDWIQGPGARFRIDGVPEEDQVVNRKSGLLRGILDGVIFDNSLKKTGSGRLGMALYVFGPPQIGITRSDIKKTQVFAVGESMSPSGPRDAQRRLAVDLIWLQEQRNAMAHVHPKEEGDASGSWPEHRRRMMAVPTRERAYRSLIGMPSVLEL